MATLGSLYHDFPRLAKQSGFYFQLHTGRVNWLDIENLDVDEIIEKRNYELLERNLINVINCNLEREYDLKILDQNFVKLFKLAQLGIDYLSYCEMYLDRCVVLLQEQLATFQEEYESLKQDNQKRKENLNRSKRKTRAQSYQCDKCEKVFISDVYLKFHDKRRHSSPNTPGSLDTSEKKCSDNSQQTEERRKLSASTQTFRLDEVICPSHSEERDDIKKDHTVKIEKLEQELKDLKERLKKAESSLTEKVENSQLNQSGVFHAVNTTGSMCCNSMLMPMLIPSYLKQPSSGYYEINTGRQIQPDVPELLEVFQPSVNSETVTPAIQSEIKPRPENKPLINTELGKTLEKEFQLSKQETKPCLDSTESFREYQNEGKENLDYDKENVNPNLKKNILTNLTKPLPPPRKIKKGIRTESLTRETTSTESSKKVNDKEEETEGFSSCSIIHRSTPIKEKPHEENAWEILEASRGNLSEINKPVSNSTESLNSRKSVPMESKSFIKKLVARKSPKLRRFSKNLKRSLTNLYDSVSSIEKDSKKRETSEGDLNSTAVNELNNCLREIGVDPEWQGIPKKTMKQKLDVLKHRRKLLSKENPMFPLIRQNLEEKIFQKIRNNLGRKKTSLINTLSKQGSMGVQNPPQSISAEDTDKPDFVKVKKSVMYNTDTDSESKTSDSEGSSNRGPDRSTSQKSVVLEELTSSDEHEGDEKADARKTKEFDFSVFQVGGGSFRNLTEDTPQKSVSITRKEVLFTDSDTEDNSVEQSHSLKIFKTFNSYLSNKNGNDTKESPKNYNAGQAEVPCTRGESHGILKEEGLQSRLSVTTKKKVLFANYSDGIEQELSDSPIDDDLWPFKSDSEKDVG